MAVWDSQGQDLTFASSYLPVPHYCQVFRSNLSIAQESFSFALSPIPPPTTVFLPLYHSFFHCSAACGQWLGVFLACLYFFF